MIDRNSVSTDQGKRLLCPCGRHAGKLTALVVGDCCQRYLADWNTPAPDAESLMRSRYTAFVQQRADYLLATWHASTRPAELDFEPGLKWLGLEVRQHRIIDATHAEVEFVARSRLQGRAIRLHERSRFVREADDQGVLRWYYVDGDML
nr:YchJ family metal-binding protein [Brachymonas denitrificans]